MTRRCEWGIAALVGAALVMYAWGLDYSPPDLADDEVAFALQAHSIATTAHDLSGRLLPLYFQMPPLGDNVWFHPVIVYFSALFLTVLPLTEATARFPSAVVGIIAVLLTYGIARRSCGSARSAIMAAALLALTPGHYMLSRLTADYIYPVPFILGWLWCLLIFLDTGRTRLLFAATLCLGFGVYSYIASLISMPFYLAVTLAVVAWRSRTPFRHGAIAVAGFALPLLLMPAWFAFHRQVIQQTLARYGQPTALAPVHTTQDRSLDAALQEVRQPRRFTSAIRRISLYWYFFDPAYLFVTGGYANPINSTRHTGVFLVSLMVFVGVGLWHIATKRPSVADILVMVGFLSAPVAALFVPEPYALDREAVLLPFGAIVAAMGVGVMTSSPRRWIRRCAAALLVLIPLQFAFFLHEYFTNYRGEAAFWFEFNHRGAVELMIDRAEREQIPAFYLSTGDDPIAAAYWRFALIKRHREDLLARTVGYDPGTLDVAGVPRGSLLMTRRDNAEMERRVAAGELRAVAEVQEIADPPQFMIVQR
jgi:4-amino-4-deoxy-L-arabinose transferase-like glycosyltransferase